MNLVEIKGRDLEETLTKMGVFGITVFELIGVFDNFDVNGVFEITHVRNTDIHQCNYKL